MPVLTLSLGSNIDAADNIRAAVSALHHHFGKLRCSSVYESEAVGFEGDNFLNLVVAVETDAGLPEIVDFLRGIEDSLGRDRSQARFSSRTMDIDVLTYGDATGADCGIKLPRPEITRHAFVLRPLAELMPAQPHGSGHTYAELWDQFDQASEPLWPVDFDWRDCFSG